VSISVQFDCVLDDIGLTVVHHCGFFTYQKMWNTCVRAGVSNTRPACRMRPSNQFYAARNNLPKML